MGSTRNVDIKLSFDRYDMTPGEPGRKFRRNLLLHGGRTNKLGYSYADCFLRKDIGALNGPIEWAALGLPNPGPAVGAPPIPPGNNAQSREATAARRALTKEAFTFMFSHIDHPPTDVVAAGARYFQDAAEFFDYAMGTVITPLGTIEIGELNTEWFLLTIITDVGCSENTVRDLDTLLLVLNMERPVANQFTNDQICEKMLTMIKDASRTIAPEALDELQRVEGAPGQPRVRQFQGPAPGGGAPRPRDRNALVNHFHALWRDAVRNGRLPKLAKVGARSPPLLKQFVEQGKAAKPRWLSFEEVHDMGGAKAYLGADVHTEAAHVALDQAASLRTSGRESAAAFVARRRGSPTRTLTELTDAGFDIRRGTVTTSDFRLASFDDLCNAAQDGDGGDEFSVEVAFDINDTMSIELLCDGCGGAGHIARVCPSPRKTRTHEYLIQLHQNAARRKDERSARRGDAPGPRRPSR
jgi:hypothetical protein